MSLLAFSLLGFYPTDCETGSDNCGEVFSTELDSCFYNNIPLHGKVKFVENFPDFTIKFVTSFPGLKVRFVDHFPDDCGEWQIVESFPDFKVKVVESFPDIEVKVVESFPGLP